MTNRYALPFVALSALAACGGGGTGGNQVDPPPAAPTVIKSYTDGSGVIGATLSEDGVTENVLLATTDPQAALQVVQGAVDLNVVDSEQNGEFYYVVQEGTSSGGESIQLLTSGENLDITGSEYTFLSVVFVDDSTGFAAGGSPVSSMPSTGSATYTGGAIIGSSTESGEGTFTMDVDFSNQTGSIAATVPSNSVAGSNNPAYFFSSNDLVLNNDGGFTASNATIGLAGTDGNSASIAGNFAGSSAAGVNGLVYENGSDWEYVGGFAGSR